MWDSEGSENFLDPLTPTHMRLWLQQPKKNVKSCHHWLLAAGCWLLRSRHWLEVSLCIKQARQAPSAEHAGCPPLCQNADPTAWVFISGKEEEVTGSQISESRCIAIVELPSATAPQFRLCSPDVFFPHFGTVSTSQCDHGGRIQTLRLSKHALGRCSVLGFGEFGVFHWVGCCL